MARSRRRTFRQSHRPARRRHRGAQSALVRGQSGQVITDVQRQSAIRYCLGWRRRSMAASRGAGRCSRQVHVAMVVLGRGGGAKHMPQLQHNMWVVAARSAVLSVITAAASGWRTRPMPIRSTTPHRTAEREFWRWSRRRAPYPVRVEPRRPRIAAVNIVDMSASNAWAEFAGAVYSTHPAFLEHERAKTEFKSLVPEDAQQASAMACAPTAPNPALSPLSS